MQRSEPNCPAQMDLGSLCSWFGCLGCSNCLFSLPAQRCHSQQSGAQRSEVEESLWDSQRTSDRTPQSSNLQSPPQPVKEAMPSNLTAKFDTCTFPAL